MNARRQYMNRCYELAEMAAAEGESSVGCLIVKNREVLGEAYEKSRQLKDITGHAEVLAILDALKNYENLAGSVLYTNIEPCIWTISGRSPSMMVRKTRFFSRPADLLRLALYT